MLSRESGTVREPDLPMLRCREIRKALEHRRLKPAIAARDSRFQALPNILSRRHPPGAERIDRFWAQRANSSFQCEYTARKFPKFRSPQRSFLRGQVFNMTESVCA